MGRPSSYTPEKAQEICELLASGMSLRKICESKTMPERPAVFRWLFNNEEFRNQYAQAREAWADAEFENIFDIADDGRNDTYKDDDGNTKTDWDVLGRSKLRIDTRRWALARMSPKKYGDKVTNEHTGPNGEPLNIGEDARARKLRALLTMFQSRVAQNNTEVDDDFADLA